MTREELQAIFQSEGLELFGIVSLGMEPSFQIFEDWLELGMHAEMDFLKNYKSLRENPSKVLENGVQALVFGWNYNQGDKWTSLAQGLPRIAQYARLKDYHKVLKARGEAIVSRVKEFRPDMKARILVDSAPILERALANKTVKGFIGKNTCFIHPQKGSLFLLGEILIDQEIFVVDQKTQVPHETRTEEGGCGTCKRCQVFCPTGALDEAYRLDARKCLAYWTIEHRGVIPFEFWPYLKMYIFGCDICQLVCPYNRAAKVTLEKAVLNAELDLFEIATMTQGDYVRLFAGSPATRAKRSGLRRNALIALAELKDSRLPAALAMIEESDEEVLQLTRRQIQERFGI